MKNYLLEKIIKNSKFYPQKEIVFENNKNITWEELIKKSKNLSQEIAKVNQNYVPIIISRNIDSIISILATIFANKAFCPISEKFPNKKIKKLFIKLKARKFINCSKKSFNIKGFKEIKNKNKRKIKIKKIPNFEKIFYILFTSGSTGEPKGVKLSYKNILNTLVWSKTYLKWKKKDFIGLATELSFDISMFDLFSSLFYNIPLFIFSNPSNPLITFNEINKYSISTIFSVPSFFSNFSNYGILKKKFNNLEQIISGGDYFPPKEILKWKKLQNKTKIFNVWGPTETSIVNSMHKLSSKDYSKLKKGENIPIGRSHKLMPIKLINEQNEIITQPFKIGEICMLGDCVSKGYLGDIENNKNYIILNKQKAFKTRDNGYFDKHKNLYFSSRIDHMIKISGYRIDALEIQKIINSIDKINNSSVFAQINKNLTKDLCLAIETKQKISIEKVRRKLKINLPLYSVPKKIFLIKKFPLNSNGKVDKKKLSYICSSNQGV